MHQFLFLLYHKLFRESVSEIRKYSDTYFLMHIQEKYISCTTATKITFAEGGRRQARQSLREAMIKHVNMLYIWLMRRRRAEKCEREHDAFGNI